ncbi:MAG TPA: hypothetical protein VHO68_07255 [Bacteroidales bacterium]|nr:hypothetical protein [Bacteroidales bacterium]
MLKNITILLFLLFIPLVGSTGGSRPGIESPVTGFIDIMVESNINKVLFTYPLTEENITPRGNHAADIIVPVKDFRCNNRIAYKDFLTLLKASDYPDIKITIPGNIIEELRENESVNLKNVMIDIAGVKKEYDIVCTPEHGKHKENVFTGTIAVALNDLNINPPEKYFGMVKIKDKVIVKFGLGRKSG